MSEPSPSEIPAPASQPPMLDYGVAGTERMVAVGLFGTVSEAYMAQVRLEREGIVSQVAGENLASLGAYVGSRGAQLLVHSSDAPRAREIFDAIQSARKARLNPTHACPDCGSTDLHRTPTRGRLSIAFVVLGIGCFAIDAIGQFSLVCWGIALLIFISRWYAPRQCNACGRVFKIKDPTDLDDDDDDDENAEEADDDDDGIPLAATADRDEASA